MNQLHVGFHKQIPLPNSGFLYIGDEVPDVPRARIFEPSKHSFNPLKDIEYRTARELASVLYTATPQGQDTLTVRNGRRALLRALLSSDKLDDIDGDEEVQGMIDDMLISPVLRNVLCRPTNFPFKASGVVLARLNRAELGDFDALILGLFLIAKYQGQVVIPDFGFYGREMHSRLIREDRAIFGVNTLSEMSLKLRQNVLLIKDRFAKGAIFEDAETLALYSGLRPDPTREGCDFNIFVDNAMSQ